VVGGEALARLVASELATYREGGNLKFEITRAAVRCAFSLLRPLSLFAAIGSG